jgi:polyisoprenoid-binding protein YceI
MNSRLSKSITGLAVGSLCVALAVGAPASEAQSQAQAQAAAPAVRAGSYKLEKTHAKLSWATSHFGFSTYSGRFDSFDARLTLDPRQPARSSLLVTIDLNSVDSDSEKLDAHLKKPDFFDTAKFPTATFRSTSVRQTGATTAQVVGDLTLHGVTKPVTLAVTFNAAGENPVSKAYTVGFSAEGTVKRSEFGISTYAPAIGDDVKLSFSGELNPA